ncbi:MAG: hypothetical protein QOK37_163 [Thermoanaerobaculia bacterium]|jgi:mannose-6-phosphate isomerase-like protein (cupin superfamily)|nr:hypothetical protein [Thermoanaerobaculia bacterium]
MFPKSRSISLFVAIFLTSTILLGQPSSYRAKVQNTPRFLQTDPDAGFENAGDQYCAPTAVSNSLMWLANHGYRKLKPEGDSEKDSQIAMIKALADSDLMNTNPEKGTDVAEVITGVQGYVENAGYEVDTLQYSGWRPAPDDAASGEYPDVDAVKEAIADPHGAAWLNVGWYRYNESTGNYARSGGHWVTVVGYDGDDLLIHDPSPRAGSGFSTQRITLEPIESGRLTGNQANLPRSAEGYFIVGGEMKVSRNVTCILDGAVVMKLR